MYKDINTNGKAQVEYANSKGYFARLYLLVHVSPQFLPLKLR